MSLKNIKNIYFIGIGGIGMSGLAKIVITQGLKVYGSDIVSNDNIQELIKLGANITIGDHEPKDITNQLDLVVYSSAVGVINPQRQKAEKLKIEQIDYHEALGRLTQDADTMVVTGSHGKTTTTSMLGLILSKTNYNPTVLVGSNVGEFKGNVSLGGQDRYVVEGDEYNKGILQLNPATVVLTNIDWDHPDIYPNENEYIETFQTFISKLPGDGHFIYNIDDHNSVEHILKPECVCVSYGIENQQADLVAKNIKNAHGRQIYKLVYKGKELKDFNLQLPGKYNIYNALAATLTALEMGVSQNVIKDSLANFKGASRRFEIIGEKNGATIISDYAHHPSELKALLNSVANFYPDRKIIVYFQPHQKNRTKMLFSDFVEVIRASQIGDIYINEIYDVPGRSMDDNISSNDIVKKVNKSNVRFVKDFATGFKEINKKLKKDNILLVVGAGDIDHSARQWLL